MEAGAAAAEGGPADGNSAAVKPTSIAEVAEYFESRRSHRDGQQSGKGVHEEAAASSVRPEDDRPQVHRGEKYNVIARSLALIANAVFIAGGQLLLYS